MIWYRVDGKLRRTIYRCTAVSPQGFFVGIMDDEDFAQHVCDALNYWESNPPPPPESERVKRISSW